MFCTHKYASENSLPPCLCYPRARRCWPPPGDASHAGIIIVLGAVHLRHPYQSWAIPQTAGGEDLSRLLLELCVVQLTVGTMSLFVLHPQNKASYQSCQIAKPATAVRLLPSSGV